MHKTEAFREGEGVKASWIQVQIHSSYHFPVDNRATVCKNFSTTEYQPVRVLYKPVRR
jgi:hypothetical protein